MRFIPYSLFLVRYSVFLCKKQTMTGRNIGAALLGVLLLAGCSSAKKNAGSEGGTQSADIIPDQPPVTLSLRTGPAISIDGDISEWQATPAFTDHSTGISTTLQADSANLYIAMHVINQATQYKMLRMGMDVYIDTGAQKKELVVIGYPVAEQNDMPDAQASAGGPNAKKILIQRASIMQTRGLKYFPNGMHLKKNANGPSAALAEDGNNNLVYEASIPLKELFGNDFRFTGNPLPLNIGCRIHGFVKKDGQDKNEQAYSGNEEGFGGRGRMRRNPMFGSNYSGAYSSDLMNIHKDVLFWMKATVQ